MKKKTILIVLLIVLAIAAVIGYFQSAKKTAVVNLVTEKAAYGYIAKSITATGNVQPVDTVSVGAQVSGVITSVYADFNSVVKKGQLLAKVDPSILTAQVTEAKANLANTNSNLQYQTNTYERQNQLYAVGAISKADYQLALNQYNSAKAAVNNAAAQLKVAEKNLSYTNIYSPIDGVVLNRNVAAGQTIAASLNAPLLFVIAKDLTKMQVNANVDEADIGNVLAGQKASFTVDAFPNEIFHGVVEDIYLHPSVSANVVTYATHINVDNKNMQLKPGMTASINIYTEEDSNALLIPSRALSFKPDSLLLKSYVLKRLKHTNTLDSQHPSEDATASDSLLSPDSKKAHVWIKNGDTLTEKLIWTGINDDSYVKVLKGLQADDSIVTAVSSDVSKKTTDNSSRSPFMPRPAQRQPANNSKSK